MLKGKSERNGAIRWVAICLVLVGLVTIGAGQAVAATHRTTATGNWTDGNWDNGSPDATNAGIVGSTVTPTAAVTAEVTVDSSVPDSLVVQAGKGSANGDAHGTLNVVSGGSLTSIYTIYAGRFTSGSTGIINVSGGTLSSESEGMILGQTGGAGTLNLSDGLVRTSEDTDTYVGRTYIGDTGTGSVYQTGGELSSPGTIHLGNDITGTGLYDLQLGTLTMSCSQINPSGEAWYTDYQGIRVGDGGSGTFLLNSTGGNAILRQTGGVNKYLSVRETEDATGLFQGAGHVGLYHYLQNSGKVVADGYGTSNALNMSYFGLVTNAIENDADNGWYAQNQGQLLLPGVAVAAGESSYNWGESQDDTAIDLVNSLSVDFTNLDGSASLSATLLALDRDDVAAAPAGVTFISCHDLSLVDATYDSFDLTVRYDDATAAGFEGQLGLYHWNGSSWDALSTTVDQTSNLVNATGVTGMTDFAVGYVPEPATLAIIGLGACLSLRRRQN